MANQTNSGTRLIEEGALLPESVRSESEPWTSFYMAGEIIRDLRMTLAIQTSQCSCDEKRHEEGGLKDDQLQRWSPTETSNRRRQLLPNNVPL